MCCDKVARVAKQACTCSEANTPVNHERFWWVRLLELDKQIKHINVWSTFRLFMKTEKQGAEENRELPKLIIGKDEMNLVEIPLGPITASRTNTMEVHRRTRDSKTNKYSVQVLTITGSEKYGLPRPIDEQFLVGLQALTHESRFNSRMVEFSQFQLCRTLGWATDGRSYRRIEECFDRLVNTTFKFKNCWWDKGENSWRSHSFHLIDNYELCSASRYQKKRVEKGRRDQKLCSFHWNDVVWKSFGDGHIRTIDMDMFRKISKGRRREVPSRLYRLLGKRFYKKAVVKIDLDRLCEEKLGLAARYPSERKRVVERAAKVLVECGYLGGVEFEKHWGGVRVVFSKQSPIQSSNSRQSAKQVVQRDILLEWLRSQNRDHFESLENAALAAEFGTDFERQIVLECKRNGEGFTKTRRVRLEFIKRFAEQNPSFAA